MKLKFLFCWIVISFVSTAFAPHKFYVAIHQVKYAEDKKMIQVISRIFVDDLNNALEKKYKQKTFLGEANQSADDVAKLKSYISEHFYMKVNGKTAALTLFTTELENNVLICYLGCRDIPKIKSLEVHNKILTELVTEQQNIIQTTVYGRKDSMLLTSETTSGTINY
ncbi:MAG TPA: DUF6702 family protein [Flavobacterium sp.]|jgi:hypothetical protein